jgi:hypothetical protein
MLLSHILVKIKSVKFLMNSTVTVFNSKNLKICTPIISDKRGSDSVNEFNKTDKNNLNSRT